MKDNFSHSSDNYARFRPVYPDSFFDFLLLHVDRRERAWDCGTGNGQVADSLSRYFSEVYATDISENQINNAVKKPNIFYSIENSSSASFPDNYFNLIIVAQAIHWFDFNKFYRELKRTAVPGAVFAAVGYGLLQVDRLTDEVTRRFYKEITGPYWDEERKYVDEAYQTIPFPFREIRAPELFIETYWTIDELLGFFRTWSAVKHYQNLTGDDPLHLVEGEFRTAWGNIERKKVLFPLLVRTGIVEK